ncbi:243_t:CDS:1, partial [Paraglomus occultum]
MTDESSKILIFRAPNVMIVIQRLEYIKTFLSITTFNATLTLQPVHSDDYQRRILTPTRNEGLLLSTQFRSTGPH